MIESMDDGPLPEDRALLHSVRGGSTAALGQLYTRHADMVYRTAYRLTASPEDAADVLQDVFLGLPRALERYREEGRFAAWLKTLAVRTALMRMRSQRRRREDPVDTTELAVSVRPDAALERVELQRALGAMPDSLRIVFVMKEIEGYSHAEIAELLEITSAASATRLLRAWRLLRQRLKLV